MSTDLMDLELAFEEMDTIQSICRESFAEFVKEFWDVLVPEELIWNWSMKLQCDEAQEMAERVMRGEVKLHDLIVNVPPGTSKSTIFSIMLPAWIWTRMPWARVITASYEHLLALNFSRKSRDVILSEKYQAAFRFKKQLVQLPRSNKKIWRYMPSTDADAVPITLKNDQNAKGFYENMAGGDRKAVGAGGNITGSHAHFIIVDDPLNPKESVSTAGLRKINRWMNETLPSRKVDKAVAPTFLIMQRLHQDDPSGHWLAKKRAKLKHICLPAKLSDEVKPAVLKVRYKRAGGFLDPIRLPQEVLDEQLMDLGKFGYAGQYDQSPIPLGGGMFEVEKINIMPRLPHITDWVSVVRYWDKAGTKDAGANTAGVKIGMDKYKRIWISDCEAGQWGVAERERNIQQSAEADGIEVRIGIEQEPGSGGKESAETTLSETLAGFRVVLDRPKGDKVTRAEPLAGQVGIGNVYVPAGAEWWPALRDELRFFPFGAKKDRVDACSGGYALLKGSRVRLGVL